MRLKFELIKDDSDTNSLNGDVVTTTDDVRDEEAEILAKIQQCREIQNNGWKWNNGV